MAKKQKAKVSPTTSDIMDKASEFLEELRKETDRGAALVGAAFIEYTLEVMLRSVLVSNAKVQKALLEYPGPLSTFASKIDLMYAMGVLSSKLRDWLHVLRRIRNECAHSYERAVFEAPRTRDLCRRLAEMMPDEVRSRLTPRDCFLGGVVNLVNALLSIQVDLRKAEPGREYHIKRTGPGVVAGQVVSSSPTLAIIGHLVYAGKTGGE